MNRLCLIAISFILVGCMGMAQQGAISQAYRLFEKGECEKVYQKLSQAESYKDTNPELQSEITFLRSMCLEREKKYDEAVALYTFIIDNFPNSEYGYRALGRIRSITGAPVPTENLPAEDSRIKL